MKNRKKGIVIACLGYLSIFFAGLTDCFAGEDISLDLPEKKIETIMIDGITYKPFQSQKLGDFRTLCEDMENVTLLDKSEAPVRGEFYIVITLCYNDGEKDNFYFFQADEDGEWYIETKENEVYQGADFIEDYVGVYEAAAAESDTEEYRSEIINVENTKKGIELDLWLKEQGIPFDNNDLRALFAAEMLNEEENWETQEAAIKAVRRTLTWKMASYQYALKNGCEVNDEELQKKMDEELKKMKSTSVYSELEAIYEEYGISHEELREYEKERHRLLYTEEKLRNSVYEQFRHGNNQIGETVCEYFDEYFDCFLSEVLLPSEETYINETLEPLLDEAEAFYVEKCTE